MDEDEVQGETSLEKVERKLKAERKRNKELMKEKLVGSQSTSQLDRLESTLEGFGKALKDAGILEDAGEQFEETLQKSARERDVQKRVAPLQQELMGIMADLEIETWDDERLSTVRRHWDSGNVDDAMRVARALSEPDTDVQEAELDAAVQKRLKAMGVKVDTSSSSAPPMSGDLEELTRQLREDPGFWEKNKEQLMSDLRTNRIPLR
jgi:hypothetical protein